MLYEHVPVQFMSGDEVADCVATIRTSDSEMVINIPEEYGPYLVRGKKVSTFFAGVDELTEASDEVIARWTELGDVWVGYWREEGMEYLFSFRLPRLPIARTKRRRV